MTTAQPSVSDRYWAIIPAAGAGTRMGTSRPKQYLPLRGKTVLEHSLTRIVEHPRIAATVVVIAAGDEYWPSLAVAYAERSLIVAHGGAERCLSVLNGLRALSGRAAPRDWVLVHDAARPCVRREDIDRLIEQLHDHPVGGLLGIPVTDTKKSTDEQGNIIRTVRREGLWRAMTPQMFRYEMLSQALQAAVERGVMVTDESAAMEEAGYTPRMVEGHVDNIKITRPQDLVLAELYLQQQERA
ncbi:MAG: 2-C-methyl-D-erythritol 4-phosphate cytidylyltransferase [Gammaproteobacteria bacterium]